MLYLQIYTCLIKALPRLADNLKKNWLNQMARSSIKVYKIKNLLY